jgi:hypothetical protein
MLICSPLIIPTITQAPLMGKFPTVAILYYVLCTILMTSNYFCRGEVVEKIQLDIFIPSVDSRLVGNFTIRSWPVIANHLHYSS